MRSYKIKNINDIVYNSGTPSYLGLEVPVDSTLNKHLWRASIWSLWLWSFGFYRVLLTSWLIYQKQFLEIINLQCCFHEHIDKYIQIELEYKALVGQFNVNPFQVPLASSPLSSVPKRYTTEHRNIMDLSFPTWSSVNDNIPKNTYFTLHHSATFSAAHKWKRSHVPIELSRY